MSKRWYVVHAYSGFEKQVAQALRDRIVRAGMEDRFGDVLVGQITTAGMERLKDELTEAIVKVLKPRQLWWKNDASIRAMELLPEYADLGHGEYGG